MAIDYEEQLAANEAERTEKTTETEAMYDQISQNYQTATDNGIAKLEQFETQQKELLNRQTDFAIQQIQQQKDQSQKDYEKEQSAAYVDFKKQSNRYGAIAEQQAAVGMTGTGYSESSQVSMYNQYQNRVAVAREAHQQAIVSYNNAMTQARLTNDVELARIAQETFMKTQELIMQNVIQQGELAIQKTEALAAIDQTYYNRGQDIKQEAATATATARSNLINAILAGRNPETVSDEELAAAGMTRAEAMAYFGTYTSEKEAADADLAYKNATVTGTNYELMVSQLTNGLDPMAVDENGNYVLTDEALAAAGMTRAMAQAFYNEWKSGKDEQAGLAKQEDQNRIIELVSKYGFTGFSDEELEAAGMTREDVQQMYQLWHGEKTSGGNGAGDGTGDGLTIEGGDGTPLTEAELLNDPSKYDMSGLAALGNDLTGEELESLINAGLVNVKVDSAKQKVVFSVSDVTKVKKILRNYREVILPRENAGSATGTNSTAGQNTTENDAPSREPTIFVAEWQNAQNARKAADEARAEYNRRLNAAKTVEETQAVRQDEAYVVGLENEAQRLEAEYDSYVKEYNQAKDDYERALADWEAASEKYRQMLSDPRSAEDPLAVQKAENAVMNREEHLANCRKAFEEIQKRADPALANKVALEGSKGTYGNLISGYGAIPTGTSTTPSVSTTGQLTPPSRQSPKRQAGGVGGPQLYDPDAREYTT